MVLNATCLKCKKEMDGAYLLDSTNFSCKQCGALVSVHHNLSKKKKS